MLSNEPVPQTRNYSYDVIRALAIFFVVFTHSTGRWVGNLDKPSVSLLMNIISPLIKTAVPMFLMLSGALLLGKEEPIGVFFKKRFSRILIPFVCWSLVVYTIHHPPRSIAFAWEFPYHLLTGGIHNIYWFVYTIIGLYLLTPLLRPALRQSAVGLWLGALALVVFLAHSFFPRIPFVEGIYIPDISHLVSYVGGFLLVRHLRGKSWLGWVSLTFFLVSLAAHILLNIFHPVDFPMHEVTAFGLFGWMTTWRLPRPRKWVTFLSETSYGIYLSHILFISLIVRVAGDWIPVWASPFVTGVLAFILTALLMWGLKKCKLKKILF